MGHVILYCKRFVTCPMGHARRWCRTDMSSQSGTKSAAEGADTAVWLALRSPKDFTTGGFYGERQQVAW